MLEQLATPALVKVSSPVPDAPTLDTDPAPVDVKLRVPEPAA
jgi:hypothetical protein